MTPEQEFERFYEDYFDRGGHYNKEMAQSAFRAGMEVQKKRDVEIVRGGEYAFEFGEFKVVIDLERVAAAIERG